MARVMIQNSHEIVSKQSIQIQPSPPVSEVDAVIDVQNNSAEFSSTPVSTPAPSIQVVPTTVSEVDSVEDPDDLNILIQNVPLQLREKKILLRRVENSKK